MKRQTITDRNVAATFRAHLRLVHGYRVSETETASKVVRFHNTAHRDIERGLDASPKHSVNDLSTEVTK